MAVGGGFSSSLTGKSASGGPGSAGLLGSAGSKPQSLSESIRVLVLGDSGVGKTTLVRLLTTNEVHRRVEWTVGCEASISVHDTGKRSFFVEWLDVGGSRQYTSARQVFYNMHDHEYHGLVLVYDLSNRNSYNNLAAWVREAFGEKQFTTRITAGARHLELQTDTPIPVLIVGNKLDLCTAPSSGYPPRSTADSSPPPPPSPSSSSSSSLCTSDEFVKYMSSCSGEQDLVAASSSSATSVSAESSLGVASTEPLRISSLDADLAPPTSRLHIEFTRFLNCCAAARAPPSLSSVASSSVAAAPPLSASTSSLPLFAERSSLPAAGSSSYLPTASRSGFVASPFSNRPVHFTPSSIPPARLRD